MKEQKENRILYHLAVCEGYEYALMTTFNLDIGFFERYVVSAMYEKGLHKINLFVDAKELSSSLAEVDNCSIGRRYFVSPIEMKGAFHPKIALLLGQDRAKLIVASANLTVNGYYRNNEIFNVFEYNTKHPENLKIISNAIQFFIAINELVFQKDIALFDEIKMLSYYGRTNRNPELFLLHNLDRSIIEQTSEIIRDADRIDVAVPFYDNDLAAIRKLSKRFPSARITLYVQNKKSCFPVSHESDPAVSALKVYDSPRPGSKSFYHGKVFRFETDTSSFILYGSANCTQAALTKAFIQGGNIECSVLEKGAAGEFDSFFESFDTAEGSLDCNPISYTIGSAQNIFFRYGILDKTLQLTFAIHKKKHYDAWYGDTKLSLTYDTDTITINEDPSVFSDAPSVFELMFLSEEGSESVRCWYLDLTSLMINRTREIRDIVQGIDFDNNEDRYLQDKELILRELPLTVDQLKAVLADRQRVKAPVSEADEESDDDGIVSFEIPPAETVQRIQRIDRIHEVCNRYIFAYHQSVTGGNTGTKSLRDSENPPDKTVHQATNYEILFQKFVSRRLRDLTFMAFSSAVSYRQYLSYCLVFEDIFKKYTVDQPTIIKDASDSKTSKEVPLFPLQFTAEAETNMCRRLLEKLNAEKLHLNDEERTDTIVLSIHAILCLWLAEGRMQDEHGLTCKRMLRTLDQLFQLREQNAYIEYVVLAAERINLRPGCKIDLIAALAFVDGLFGYKDEKKLRVLLKEAYGEQANIIIDIPNKDVLIRTTVKDIGQHMKIRERAFKELDGFCRHWGIPQFQIVIENGRSRFEYHSSNATRFVVYDGYCGQKVLTQTIRSFAGKETKKSLGYTLY